ncbi:MAG TPA: hypothetical protein VER55_14615 [Ardenticatenaceae bacterium]|nr:hypothetical protein [Ardenticatenaceae bacterium]
MWILLGVTAIVARLWVYHAVYDDVLIVLAMVGLFRIARHDPSLRSAHAATLLLVVTIVAMLVPARLFRPMTPWSWLCTTGHVVVWMAVLIFLLHRVRPMREAAVGRAMEYL